MSTCWGREGVEGTGLTQGGAWAGDDSVALRLLRAWGPHHVSGSVELPCPGVRQPRTGSAPWVESNLVNISLQGHLQSSEMYAVSC